MTTYLPRLEGKVAFITGVARGQGRAEAIRLAGEGADIIGIDNCESAQTTAYKGPTEQELEDTVGFVEALGRRMIATKVDVRDFDAMSAAVAHGVSELGRLDVVVANAGICSAKLTWEISAEMWQETIDTNLTGVFHTIKATVPPMLEQGSGGSIIITSSVAGLRGLPFMAHYAASKHGVVGLAKTLANELGEHCIRVNTVHPFGVESGMQVDDLAALVMEHASTLAPVFMTGLPQEMSQPEDIAAAVAWLASDDSRHVTGIQLPIDLGTLAR